MKPAGRWFSRGKLLITGEYLVMEGAKAFAVPLIKGQSLEVYHSEEEGMLHWEAYTDSGSWFSARFSLPGFQIINTDDEAKALFLKKLFGAIREQNKDFLKDKKGYRVITKLDFNPEFGFGSSSTLINNLASWAKVDPFALQFRALGGSGYDIACAAANGPGIYRLADKKPLWQSVPFNPVFTDRLYFVWLGNKQNSYNEVRRFKSRASFNWQHIEEISKITEQLVATSDFAGFKSLLELHEQIMSSVLKKETVKKNRFGRLDATVKSLGAWGGDFALIATEIEKKYLLKRLNQMGYFHIFAWQNLVKYP